MIDRNPPNFRLARSPARSTDHADSEPDIGADLRRFFECKRSQSAVTGYRSPEWPPRSLLDQQGRPSFGNLVRMGPGPTAYQLLPRPSTSAGSMTWQETKRVLDPLNQESKKECLIILLWRCPIKPTKISVKSWSMRIWMPIQKWFHPIVVVFRIRASMHARA